jgi:hypothetical protein
VDAKKINGLGLNFREAMRKVTCGMKVFLVLALFFTAALSYALPFTIIPKPGTSLPTSWVAGQTVNAYYTIINNTGSQRNNSYIRFLPLNVVQVTSGGANSDTCGSTFNLGPNGSAADSCTLQLSVVGPVDGNDPDPSHHIFACFPGGKTCAGTDYPLNVTQGSNPPPPPATLLSIAITPSAPTVVAGSTLQLTATGTYSDGSTKNLSTSATWVSSAPAVATVSNTGLVTGVTVGTTNITAAFGGFTSPADVVTVAKQIIALAVAPTTMTLYGGNTQQMTATATYADSSTGDVTSQVTWTSANPIDATVSTSGLVTGTNGIGTDPFNITATIQGLSASSVATTILTLYSVCGQTSSTSPTINACNINPANGNTASCNTISGSASGIRAAYSIAINTTGTVLIAASYTNNFIIGCSLSGNSPSNSCTYSTGVGASQSTAIDNNNNVYASNGGAVFNGCTIAGNNGVTCTTNSGISTNGSNMGLNPTKTRLYIPNGNNLSNCLITNGVLGSCVNTTASPASPGAIAIDGKNNIAYVDSGKALNAGGVIYACTYTPSSGDISNCNATSLGGFSKGVFGVAVDPSFTYLYLSDVAGNAYVCTLNAAGTLSSSNCVSVGGLFVSGCGVNSLTVK